MSLQITVARDAEMVTPSDTTKYSPPLNGIWVGGAGDVSIVTPAGNGVTFSTVSAGTLLPVQAAQIMDTNTTATLITGFK